LNHWNLFECPRDGRLDPRDGRLDPRDGRLDPRDGRLDPRIWRFGPTEPPIYEPIPRWFVLAVVFVF